MSNLISINIQEIDPAQSIYHSARSKIVSYLVADPNTITTYRHDLDSINIDMSNLGSVRDYFKLHTAEIKSDYQNYSKRNQKMQDKTKLYQEAVISFGRDQFEKCNQSNILKSISDFCNNFEQKYGCKILMSSLHLDEGYKSESKKILYNYHTHILIENYSFDTHKTCLQKLDYRKLQTELANQFQHLGFERGKDYTKLQKIEDEKAKTELRKPDQIKPVRLEHREYRQMKEQGNLLDLRLENIQLKNTLETLEDEKQLIDSTHKQLKTDSIIKNSQISQLQEQLKLIKNQYDADRKKLKESGEAKQIDYQNLKTEYEQIKSRLMISENKNLTKPFESFKPTFSREVVDYTRQIEDTYNSLTLFSKNKHEITIDNPDTWKKTTQILTTKEVKRQHERLTQAKIVAINKLEIYSNQLAKALEKTSMQLRSFNETSERLRNTEHKYWQMKIENDNLIKENRTLKSIEGNSLQQLQAKFLSQSDQVRILSMEKLNLEITKNTQKKQIDDLLTENTSLKTAIGHFLNLSMVKPFTNSSKSLLDMFKSILEPLETLFNSLKNINACLEENLTSEKTLTKTLTIELESMKIEDKSVKFKEQTGDYGGIEM